jgi:hypothetical protein
MHFSAACQEFEEQVERRLTLARRGSQNSKRHGVITFGSGTLVARLSSE